MTYPPTTSRMCPSDSSPRTSWPLWHRVSRSSQQILPRKLTFIDPQPCRDRGSDIGEALANAEVTRLTVADGEEWDPLAGMIRSSEGRVVAVVCDDDQKVLFG